jgi:hypothetical protein
MSDFVIEEKEVKEITVHDRCDQCGGQAYVLVSGITGELFFCGHHFSKIEKNETAHEKLISFAYVVHDQRANISDKRAGI